jgi:hypothetical protein
VVVRFDVRRARTSDHFWLLLDRLGNEAPPWLERELDRWGRLNAFGGIEPVRHAHLVS